MAKALGIKTCETAVQMAATYNRRTLDLLGARLFRLWGLAAEKSGGTKGLAALRPQMLAYHRTSCVRHDIPGQEVLLNLLLRSYLSERLYAQAERLRSRAPLPEGALGARSNAQQARYLHYLGRIRAVHLEYTEAKECLSQALRKAPARAAAGFRMLTTKWLVVVRMLLGETPERIARLQGLEFADGAGVALVVQVGLCLLVQLDFTQILVDGFVG